MLFLHPRLHHYQRSRFASLFLTVLPTVCFVVLFLGWCVTGLFQTYRLLYYSRTESAINIERLYITTNHLMDFLAPQRFLLLTRYNIFLGIATIVANSAQNEQAMQMLIHLPSACWWRCPQTVSKDNRLGQPQTPIFMLTQKIIRQICRSYALMG